MEIETAIKQIQNGQHLTDKELLNLKVELLQILKEIDLRRLGL